MNIDQHQLVPQRYGIRSIPTLLVFKGGQVVGQIVGAVPRAKIEDDIRRTDEFVDHGEEQEPVLAVKEANDTPFGEKADHGVHARSHAWPPLPRAVLFRHPN